VISSGDLLIRKLKAIIYKTYKIKMVGIIHAAAFA